MIDLTNLIKIYSEDKQRTVVKKEAALCVTSRPSVPCPPLARKWKTIQRSNILPTSGVISKEILRSKGKGRGHWGRKCENRFFDAYLREK